MATNLFDLDQWREPELLELEALEALGENFDDMPPYGAASGIVATEVETELLEPQGSASSSIRITRPATGGGRGKIRHELSDSPGWQDYANCLGVDPDLFFPERGASTREAKETCRGCVVRDDCLEYALVNGEKFGIWGGMSERERRRLRRQRAIAHRASEAATYLAAIDATAETEE